MSASKRKDKKDETFHQASTSAYDSTRRLIDSHHSLLRSERANRNVSESMSNDQAHRSIWTTVRYGHRRESLSTSSTFTSDHGTVTETITSESHPESLLYFECFDDLDSPSASGDQDISSQLLDSFHFEGCAEILSNSLNNLNTLSNLDLSKHDVLPNFLNPYKNEYKYSASELSKNHNRFGILSRSSSNNDLESSDTQAIGDVQTNKTVLDDAACTSPPTSCKEGKDDPDDITKTTLPPCKRFSTVDDLHDNVNELADIDSGDVSNTILTPNRVSSTEDEIAQGGYRGIDVLLGRGGFTNKHPGNQNFRSVAKNLRREYKRSTSKKHKKVVSQRLVSIMTQMGARLLKYNAKENLWQEVNNSTARNKCNQVLREEYTQEAGRKKRHKEKLKKRNKFGKITKRKK